MIFGISDEDLLDKNKIKIINGIAGSGKSTQTVNQLRALNESFCLASFSNALKFAAYDKFGCDVDTICGLEFINVPCPRACEREVTEYSTVVNDEILLDGLDCLNWMKHNVGKVNIIALTDSRQMLSAENSTAVIKEFEKLISRKDVIHVEVTKTMRARNQETIDLYNVLYNLDSNVLFNVKNAQDIFKCDIMKFEDLSYNENDTYICHSNLIEHELYKMYDISNRRDITLIPKNSISRKRDINFDKYPICDQITATDKNINAYLQAANIATPTRYQGKEVSVGNKCYFMVEEGSYFTGREIYTVGTRCQDMASITIVLVDTRKYNDPVTICNTPVVEAKRLNIVGYQGEFQHCSVSDINKMTKTYGDKDTYYKTDFATAGNKIIASTLHNFVLNNFATIKETEEGVEATIEKKKAGRTRTIKSIVKNDPALHFDYIPRVYDIVNIDIRAPRVTNIEGCSRKDFTKMFDIYSAFPTILHYCDMPCAGFLYEEYDKDLLNFYIYKGDKVTKNSLITEKLAEKLGDSEYVFSTKKQIGCSIGHYTYEQCHASKEKKKKINEVFKWGMLESSYYKREVVSKNGKDYLRYVKYKNNTLQLIASALWSELCFIMLNIIEELKLNKYVVATDGLYYNGDELPNPPEWVSYRVVDLTIEKSGEEKYENIIFKNYEDLPDKRQTETERKRAYRARKKAEAEE